MCQDTLHVQCCQLIWSHVTFSFQVDQSPVASYLVWSLFCAKTVTSVFSLIFRQPSVFSPFFHCQHPVLPSAIRFQSRHLIPLSAISFLFNCQPSVFIWIVSHQFLVLPLSIHTCIAAAGPHDSAASLQFLGGGRGGEGGGGVRRIPTRPSTAPNTHIQCTPS